VINEFLNIILLSLAKANTVTFIIRPLKGTAMKIDYSLLPLASANGSIFIFPWL